MMERLLLKNGLLWKSDAKEWHKQDILIRNQKIEAVSNPIDAVAEPSEYRTVDLMESYVLPGLIDCHTHLGIIEEGTGKIGVDNNETSDPVTPELRGIDAVNPQDIAFRDAVMSGITTVMSGPGSDNVVGGQNLALKTSGRIIDEMCLRNPVGLKIALGENPITMYGEDKKRPVTRMGTAGLIRELFWRAQDYLQQKERGQIKERNLQLEAVIPVLRGEISLRAHAHRADDIVTAVRLADEFGIRKLVIEHGTEADLVSDYLSKKNVPVAFGPMLTPRIKMELKHRNYASVLKLVDAGIKVGLITDHPYNSIDQLRTIAVLAVSEGLAYDEALKCITVNPAEILEVQDRIGKLEVGFDADLAVFSGDPFDIQSKVLLTIINGRIVYAKSET